MNGEMETETETETETREPARKTASQIIENGID